MRLTCSLTLAKGGPPTYRMMSFGTHDQVVDDGFDERNLPGYQSAVTFASLYSLNLPLFYRVQISVYGALDGRIIAVGDAISDIYKDDRRNKKANKCSPKDKLRCVGRKLDFFFFPS